MERSSMASILVAPMERLTNALPTERLSNVMSILVQRIQHPSAREHALAYLRYVARVFLGILLAFYLALVCSYFFVPYTTVNTIIAENPNFYVDTSTGRIKDSLGRERIFHGVNVVVKGAPWLPQLDHFDPQLSFSDKDILIMKRLGLNVVRLGVMWPGVHPARGTVNGTYLGLIKDLVHRMGQAGIYTLVDFHQDVFGGRFCGEGVPDWLVKDLPFSDSGSDQLREKLPEAMPSIAVKPNASALNGGMGMAMPVPNKSSMDGSMTSGSMKDELADMPCIGFAVCMKPEEYAKSFPEPLSARFIHGSNDDPRDVVGPTLGAEHQGLVSSAAEKMWRKGHGLRSLRRESVRQGHIDNPSREECDLIDWGMYHFTFAVSRAFQDLYENRWGWRDRLADYWRDVAAAMKGEDSVLGFDLINEPWVGDLFLNPLLLLPGVADRLNYAPMYEHLQGAIREVDPTRLLFFEGTTFDDIASGFPSVPGGQVYANMSVISYHYYRPPNVAPRATFLQREEERKRLGCGWMLTEFGIPNRCPEWLTANGGGGGHQWMELEPGQACLPAQREQEQEQAVQECARRGLNNRCIGETAKSWSEFVEAWGSVANASRSSVHRGTDRGSVQWTAARAQCREGPVPPPREGHAQHGTEMDHFRGSQRSRSRALRFDGPAASGASEPKALAILQEPFRPISREHVAKWVVADAAIASESLQAKPAAAMSNAAQRVLSGEEAAGRGQSNSGALEPGGRRGSAASHPVGSQGQAEDPDLGAAAGGGGRGSGREQGKQKKLVPGSWDEMVETLRLADDHVQSWMAWEYKAFVPITGADYGLFEPDGGLHPLVLQFFWRTYPVAVAGSIMSFSFDPYASNFTMVYRAAAVGGEASRQHPHSVSEHLQHIVQRLPRQGFSAFLVSPTVKAAGEHALAERTTEIFMCCSREMEVEVQEGGVQVQVDAERSVVLLRHNQEHAGSLIHVKIYPKA